MPSPDNYFQAIVHQTGGKKSYKYEVSGKDVNDTIAKGIAEIGSLNEPVMQNIINDMNTFAKNILQAARSHDRGSLKHSCKNYAILLAQRLQEKHVFQVEFDVNEDKKIILKEVDTTSDKYKGAIYGGLHVLQKAKQRYSNLYPNGAQTPQNSQNQNTAPVNSNVVNNTNNTPTQSNNNSNVGNNTNNTNTQQNQSGATQTNGNTASTSHIPGKDTLDNTSIIKALLDDLKAGLIKNTSQKMQEQQTNQRALKDIQDSSDFENELNKKQRDGVIALMRLLSDANSIFIDNKGEFAKSVKQSLDLMNQGNAELSIIANQNGEFQDDVDMSYVIYQSLIEKLENAIKNLSRCGHNFKTVNGKITASGMLAKSLDIMRKYNTQQLLEAKNNQFLSSIQVDPDLNYTYNNTFIAVAHNIKSCLKDFNNELTCDNLATFLSTHCVSDLVDAVRYIVSAVSDSISQTVSLTAQSRTNPYYYSIGKVKSLQDSLNKYTENSKEKKDFVPIVEVGKSQYIGYDAPYAIPKYVDKVDATTDQGQTLEYIGTVIDQKIQSLSESKLMPFAKEFLFTTNILDNFIPPFPTNYSVDQSGNRMNSNVNKYLTVRDYDFQQHVISIQKKLDIMLVEYASVKEILKKFKEGCEGLGEVTLSSYDANGSPQTSNKSAKELAAQQITQIEKMLEIRKNIYVKNANAAVMRLFHKGKMQAIRKTLESADLSLNHIIKVLRSISHLIPTQEEKVFEEAIDNVNKRTEEISESITQNFLKILANAISVLGIPIKSLESTIASIVSSVKFESFYDKQMNFISGFTEKLMNLVAEGVEFATGLSDMYDKCIFKIEEQIPNFKLLVKTFLIVFVVAFLTQNNPELLQATLRILKSLIPDTQTSANVVSPF